MYMRTLAVVPIAASLLVTASAIAQSAPEAQGRSQATRVELEERVRRLEDLAALEGGSDPRRAVWAGHLTAVKARLTDGDFRAGDRIVVVVESDPNERSPAAGATSIEQQLTDTFTVGVHRELTLPLVGTVPLRGVLRSELDSCLTAAVGRFIHSPSVQVRQVMRISVQGGVAMPGFYMLSTDAVLSDALMAAGGPARDSRVGKLRIERDGETMWKGDTLQRALAAGRTLEDMGFRGGEQFVVPERSRTSEVIRTLGVGLGIPVTIFTLIRLF